jgi:hypothetical protein
MNHFDAAVRSAIAAEYSLSDRTYILHSIEQEVPQEVCKPRRRFWLFKVEEEATC